VHRSAIDSSGSTREHELAREAVTGVEEPLHRRAEQRERELHVRCRGRLPERRQEVEHGPRVLRELDDDPVEVRLRERAHLLKLGSNHVRERLGDRLAVVGAVGSFGHLDEGVIRP
jgi:hypothetical protein